MANIEEKAYSILARNLNSGLSYLITTEVAQCALSSKLTFAFLGHPHLHLSVSLFFKMGELHTQIYCAYIHTLQMYNIPKLCVVAYSHNNIHLLFSFYATR